MTLKNDVGEGTEFNCFFKWGPSLQYYTYLSIVDEITTKQNIILRYAGPGTQTYKSNWKMGWSAYLASTRGFIVAEIDGRGSGGEGDRRRFEIWERLGSVEVSDQIEVAKYLSSTLSIIDPRRVAIWGWSYGGYVTLRALSDEDQDVFQCGIAVAPVTNWRFYGESAPYTCSVTKVLFKHLISDSVYTERYMGQPGVDGNYKGYEESDVVQRASGFHPTAATKRKLYLIHGTRDDNVHLQHSMVLAKALVREGVDFRQQV
jgi:dipeptidyl aminopeptidase/acylaminoacyl peptidase